MVKPARGRRRAAAPAHLPRFTLYGEAAAPAVELLHVEAIESRSRLYHWEIDAHVHGAHHQLLWLRRGRAEVRLDESRSTLQGPALVAIPPGVAHAFRFAPHTDGQVLTLATRALVEGDPAIDPAALQALFGRPRALALAADDEAAQRLDALFAQLLREAQAPGLDGDGPVPLWLARAIVWRAAQAAARHTQASVPGRPARQAALHTRFLALVESHYLEHWPVQRYAERLGTSTDRLNRVTRAHAGRSALQLVHERLLREACRRLTYLVAPVSKLAFELGFDDPAYFCRFFKRGMGLSPTAFRGTAQAEPLA
ncbi:MAG: helix-turn-helix domain-containing protein [Rubrivivax sp.]